MALNSCSWGSSRWRPTPSGRRTAAGDDPCAPPRQNPIVCENPKPGSPPSEWDVQRRRRLQHPGLRHRHQRQPGQTRPLQDRHRRDRRTASTSTAWATTAATGARKVATVHAVGDAAAEPAGLPDRRQRPGWSTAATGRCRRRGRCRSTAVSGIYFAKLVARRTRGGASHIVFVVRDDDGALATCCSRPRTRPGRPTTSYGGNSLYVGGPGTTRPRLQGQLQPAVHDPRRPRPRTGSSTPSTRWSAGSRPTATTSATSPASTPTAAAAELLEHKVFLSVGHDEYWSGAQRANVEAARDAGVNLAFFSGNEVFWKTRWENEHRRLGHAVPHAGLLQGDARQRQDRPDRPTWTGTWRDPRFSPPADGGRPENALTGTIFTVNCWHRRRSRCPRPTASCASGATPASPTLAAGADGDARPTARSATSGTRTSTTASRPAGLFRLSSTTVDVGAAMLAGLRLDLRPGHRDPQPDAVPRTRAARSSSAPARSSGRGASTATTTAATDAADRDMQQATVNLFADMGVAAATRCRPASSPATASTDTTPPTSTITSPADGATVAGGHAGRRSPAPRPTPAAARSAASRSRSTAARPGTAATGPRQLDATPGRPAPPGTRHDPEPRRRRQRQHRDARAPAVTVNVGVPRDLPVLDLVNDSTTPAERPNDASAVELGVKFRSDVAGFITGIRFYKGPRTPARTSATCGRPTARCSATATFTDETASGWQQVTLRRAGRDHREHDLRRLVPHAVGLLRRRRQLLRASAVSTTRRCTRSPTASTAPNGVYRYGAERRFPTRHFNVEQLLGRRRLRHRRSAPDTTPPTVSSPLARAAARPASPPTPTSRRRSASRSTRRSIDGTTFELRDAVERARAGDGQLYDAAQTARSTLEPTAPLAVFDDVHGDASRAAPAGVKDVGRQRARRRRHLVVHHGRRRRRRRRRGPGRTDPRRSRSEREPVQPLLRRDPARRGAERVRRDGHLATSRRRCSTRYDVVDPRRDAADRRQVDDADRLGERRAAT